MLELRCKDAACEIGNSLAQAHRKDEIVTELSAGVSFGKAFTDGSDYCWPLMNTVSRIVKFAEADNLKIAGTLRGLAYVQKDMIVEPLWSKRIKDLGILQRYASRQKACSHAWNDGSFR